jgi:arsenite methyltransferase
MGLTAESAVTCSAGVDNVVFLKGVIEQIPLPAESVDVVISSCVIDLSVLPEIGRVLRRPGRFVGCIVGAPSEVEYEAALTAAGFIDVRVADRMHFAIVKAVKPRWSEARFLPPLSVARSCGCC